MEDTPRDRHEDSGTAQRIAETAGNLVSESDVIAIVKRLIKLRFPVFLGPMGRPYHQSMTFSPSGLERIFSLIMAYTKTPPLETLARLEEAHASLTPPVQSALIGVMEVVLWDQSQKSTLENITDAIIEIRRLRYFQQMRMARGQGQVKFLDFNEALRIVKAAVYRDMPLEKLRQNAKELFFETKILENRELPGYFDLERGLMR